MSLSACCVQPLAKRPPRINSLDSSSCWGAGKGLAPILHMGKLRLVMQLGPAQGAELLKAAFPGVPCQELREMTVEGASSLGEWGGRPHGCQLEGLGAWLSGSARTKQNNK